MYSTNLSNDQSIFILTIIFLKIVMVVLGDDVIVARPDDCRCGDSSDYNGELYAETFIYLQRT